MPAEFLATHPPPLWLTLYHLVTRLPDTLRAVKDHFLAHCPTELTIALLEKELLAAETSIVAVGASRGDPRTPRSALRLPRADAAAARAKGARVVAVTAGEAAVGGGGGSGGGGSAGGASGSGGGGGGSGGGGGRSGGGGWGGGGRGGGRGWGGRGGGSGGGGRGGTGGGQGQQHTPSPQEVREWYSQHGGGGGLSCTYVIRTGDRTGQQATELPRWLDLLKKGIDIYALDFDAILFAMYVMSTSGEGAEYLCVPPDPGIRASASAAPGTRVSATPGAGEAAALGARVSPLLGTASTAALHTFTLDSGASRCFFRDRTALEPLARPVAVSLADPSGVRSLRPLPLSFPALRSRRAHCQRAAPHSSSLPPTTASLQTLHMDVWGPARVRGQGQERYFLIVVDDYSRYTSVFPLRTKGEGLDVLIPWIRRARLQLSERFHSDFPVLRLHSDRGGEFSSDLLAAYCAEHGIEQLFTLPASPQQNGVAERRIGLVMEVAHLAHAAVDGGGWRCVAFWVWGSRAFVRDTSADKLSSRAVPCVFLGFVPDASGWQFYHATSRRVLPSQDVTFDESVPYYRLFPYRTAPLPPPPLFLAPGAAVADPLPPQGAALSGVSQVDPVEPVEVAVDSRPAGGAEPGGAEPGGVEPGGVEPGGVEPGGVEPGGVELEGAELGGVEPRGAELRSPKCGGSESGAGRTTGTGASASSPVRELPSREWIREWYERRCTLRSGVPRVTDPAAVGAAAGAEDPGVGAAASAEDPGVGAAAGAEDPGVGAAAGAEDPGVGAAAGAEDPGVGATAGAADPGVGAATCAEDPGIGAPAGAEDVGAGAAAGAADPGAGVSAGSGVAARSRPYFVPLLQEVLGQLPPPFPPPSLACPPPVQLQSALPSASSLPGPAPYTGPTGGLTKRREPATRPTSPESRPESPVRTALSSSRVQRKRLPAVPGTHRMALRPSTAPQRVPLPSPPASSLPALADPGSDSLRATSPTVTRLLATILTDPSFESAAASALVAELVDFAARCRLDYAASLVAEFEQEEFECFAAALPHLVSMLVAPEVDPDAPDIPTPRSYAEAMASPYSSQWQSAMDTEMASWKSTGTYVDEVPPPGANIVSGMWIFRVKRPPGSPPVFKARYVARGFSQREGVDFFLTFSPNPKMTTLRVLLHVAAQRDYELHSLDFSTAFLQGSLHEEIWLRRPPGFTGSFPPGTQWSLRRPVYGLRQAPREWHDTLRTTLAALGFAPSTADPSLFLRTDTSLPPFYVLVYIDDLVFATADTVALAHVKSELQKRHTCTDLGEMTSYLGLRITRDRARRTITLTQSHMVQQVLQRFRFTYSSPQPTPLPTGHSLSALPSDESVEPSGPYPELVGCLMYLMTCTRPDLAYPLSILARYVAPGRHRKEHMDAAKRVLRYLCSTSGMGLVLGGRVPVVLTGHSDASWADDQATQRSSQGYSFSLGSGSVSWRSTRSSSVLSSSCEAEIYATAMAA
ncbi:unnamed protein product [Closterium sp. NIES-64]|nr:unnamed protein product [Closterium sp. NIES-64]